MSLARRARLLWDYLAGNTRLGALPVNYAVETTVRCNLYCPMCPRESRKQPNADMSDDVFERAIRESIGVAEHVMLIGYGEPLLDRKIFERIEYCARHDISTLISTNGTLLDEEAARRLLKTRLRYITLSIDGATKESYEQYRKGGHFESVRDNFVRFARLKKEMGTDVQVVVQMIQMEGNADEIDEFRRFWSAVPGVDQVRVKPLEIFPDFGPQVQHSTNDWSRRCHHLWHGPPIVSHDGDVYPCCTGYSEGRHPLGRLGEQSIAEIWNSEKMQRMRALHDAGRGHEVDLCARCTATFPHPLFVVGSLIFHTDTARKLLVLSERLIQSSPLLERLVRPAREDAAPAPQPAERLVQITVPSGRGRSGAARSSA